MSNKITNYLIIKSSKNKKSKSLKIKTENNKNKENILPKKREMFNRCFMFKILKKKSS